ncbi:ras-related protein Rab-35-like [Paramacrobiotus metropolitanus]|uniref:ras-related protein Rab-35-like n=1 Tax=Paramacrobiotus metropolitanus TaxID=2943436 RepID=UPI00244561EE|nr:ras-related protein Rab-35-like [Paramacrobiotus metropolitanus]XP_055357746.1 ras-related protein Rab-35-like [Paramacrobiotus metropolitanus]XP_055357748.1 ras-related protein Rab-35-like [Paramacrobiotus metropolitanus]
MVSPTETVRQWVSDFVEKKEPKYSYKVLLIGDCVGKSSLLLRFYANDFIEDADMKLIPMTIGLDVKSKILDIEGPGYKEQVTLNIWDTAGQDRFRSLNGQYLPSADAVILLYDVRNLNSFKNCRYFVEDVEKFCDDDVVRILVGNKDDSDDSLKVVSSQRAHDYAVSIGFKFLETSAKDNRNVFELFTKVAQLCFARQMQMERLQ